MSQKTKQNKKKQTESIAASQRCKSAFTPQIHLDAENNFPNYVSGSSTQPTPAGIGCDWTQRLESRTSVQQLHTTKHFSKTMATF